MKYLVSVNISITIKGKERSARHEGNKMSSLWENIYN